MEPAEPTRVERRLAAILAADVAGYSRLIEADEEGTLNLRTCHVSSHSHGCLKPRWIGSIPRIRGRTYCAGALQRRFLGCEGTNTRQSRTGKSLDRWKDTADKIPLAVRRIRTFLRAHRPVAAATPSIQPPPGNVSVPAGVARFVVLSKRIDVASVPRAEAARFQKRKRGAS